MAGLPPGGAEAVVIDLYTDALTEDGQPPPQVGQHVRNPRVDGPYVQVIRTGGTMQHRVLDRAQITTTAWCQDEVEAEALARRCRDILQAATRIRPGLARITRVEILSFYYDPDPDSTCERYTFTAIVTIRAA